MEEWKSINRFFVIQPMWHQLPKHQLDSALAIDIVTDASNMPLQFNTFDTTPTSNKMPLEGLADNPFVRAPADRPAPALGNPEDIYSFKRVVGADSSANITMASNPSMSFGFNATTTKGRCSSASDATPPSDGTVNSATGPTTASGSDAPSSSAAGVVDLSHQELLSSSLPEETSDIINQSLCFWEPTSVLDTSVQQLRLFVLDDVDVFPFKWIEALLSSKVTSFPRLQNVQLYVNSLVRPFIGDVIESRLHFDAFATMLSRFGTSTVKLDIYFSTVGREDQREDGTSAPSFRQVDVATLHKAVSDLMQQEHTEAFTDVLGPENRVRSEPLRPTEEGCRKPYRHRMSEPEDDEYL
ncbi:hypothetical protein K458DRAFT_466189 [Lentithecium fluviatile CBS 122367]|uniref:Uncharacterized protein n=1 Tax=Lentithecium fluviatile CBS 122367 TaxID=1168545 RepID=A0A6G1IHQ2_9PLEO|nr:hypothetical protein K458DRAFT_466189 [Lentithecium fluviatile CBS 122367]